MSAIQRVLTFSVFCALWAAALRPAQGQIVAMPLSMAADEGAVETIDVPALPTDERLPLREPTSPWYWQPLPVGRVYPAYLAGEQESRLRGLFVYEKHFGWITDDTLGARVGVLRYGNDNVAKPEGWQLDFEAAAFPRLSLEDLELVSSDFRYGVPLTYRSGQFETKFAFYHISSHLSDLYLEKGNPSTFYSRNALVWGLGWRPFEALRFYGEVGWAFYDNGPGKPWEFQFGAEYSQLEQDDALGSPFWALNAHLRQEVDFGGYFTLQAGWQWRNQIGQLFRVGLEFLTGKSDQFQFQARNEEQIGLGLWYDF
jgi:hypothetical protein